MKFSTLQETILRAIVRGPLAWSTCDELAPAGATNATLGAMERDDLVGAWRFDDKPTLWTLSPFSAAALGVRLGSPKGLLRWIGPGQAPTPIRRPRHAHPWAEVPKPPSPPFLCDEVWGGEILLFGRRIPLDPRLSRRGSSTAPIRRRPGRVPAAAATVALPDPPRPDAPPPPRRGASSGRTRAQAAARSSVADLLI